ncbi:MAG: hypothetical protein FJX65_17745 [Alphaproteobacteria bacterium]|nr:hypothetical protein [Alphaproteobacteria bacterium]
MRRSRILPLGNRAGMAAALIIALVYTASVAGQTGPARSPDHGIGGYTGSVTAIREPVLLRLREASMVEGRLLVENDEQGWFLPRVSEARLSGLVQREGEALRFEINVNELSLDGRRLPMPGSLLALRGLMDDRGAWRDAEVDPLPQIRAPDKGKLIPVGGQWVGKKLATGALFGARPVRQGEELFASREIDRRLAETSGEEYAITRNTLSARARGLAQVDGRPHVVGVVSGTIDVVGRNGDTYQVAPRGHVLIDAMSGLPRLWVRAAITGTERGVPIARSVDVTFDLVGKK